MRTTFTTVSLVELRNFNTCVWDMLRAIQRLVTIPDHGPNHTFLTKKVEFTFTKEKGYTCFTAKVRFVVDDMQETPLVLNPPFLSPVTFNPPEGCSEDQIFEWLLTEVSKMSYAMTQGQVQAYGLKKEVDDYASRSGKWPATYSMAFIHYGPDQTDD